MKLFKRLKAYKEEEAQESRLGFGILKAKDYDADKFGYLILFSLNIMSLRFIKKFFISF